MKFNYFKKLAVPASSLAVYFACSLKPHKVQASDELLRTVLSPLD